MSEKPNIIKDQAILLLPDIPASHQHNFHEERVTKRSSVTSHDRIHTRAILPANLQETSDASAEIAAEEKVLPIFQQMRGTKDTMIRIIPNKLVSPFKHFGYSNDPQGAATQKLPLLGVQRHFQSRQKISSASKCWKPRA